MLRVRKTLDRGKKGGAILRSAEESDLKLNQTVFFSPFCCQDMCQLAFCEKDELIFC